MLKNPKLHSHKFNQAALAYEIALLLWENKCVHVNGPFEASIHDKAIFEEESADVDGKPKGLKNKTPDRKKAIGNKPASSAPQTHTMPLKFMNLRAVLEPVKRPSTLG